MQDTLNTAGDYVILAYSAPILYIKELTGVNEILDIRGTGTIFKKEFRYFTIDLLCQSGNLLCLTSQITIN